MFFYFSFRNICSYYSVIYIFCSNSCLFKRYFFYTQLIFLKNKFINLKLNNYFYIFLGVCTIYQACIQKGLYLPRFCYHVKLKLAGNCRLCFIEDSAFLKPVIACATLIYNNAIIFSNTSFVYKSRENIIEFLLCNHPLDCPVCDQGGECDLQDQFIVMGNMVSRFYEDWKKNTENMNISFILKLSLNKCINCSRCTRYAHDICGEYSFSLLGRGENLKISNYHSNYYLFSEIIGNMIDLCPVGAITLKNIAYSFRFWELLELKFVDFLDVLHSPIRIDFRGLNIIRVLPIVDDLLQEEWISDSSRFNFDFFNNFREKMCLIKKNFKIIAISWLNVFYLIKTYYFKLLNFFINKKSFFLNVINFSSNATEIYQSELNKLFFSKFSFFNTNFFKNSFKNYARINYLNNKLDLDFLKVSFFVVINLNLRYSLPIINFKVREKIKFDYNTVVHLGPLTSSNIFFLHYGNSVEKFINFLKKKKFNLLKQNFVTLIGKNLFSYFDYFKFIQLINFKTTLIILNFACIKSFEILASEINLFYKNFNFSNSSFFSFFNSFYSINCNLNQNNNFFLNNKNLKLSSDDNCNFDSSNVSLPLISIFEKPALFLNIFGNLNDFTYSFYRYFSSNYKNDLSIISLFSEIFFYEFIVKISFLQRKFIPKYWIKQNYYLKIFNYAENIFKRSIVNNFYLASEYTNFFANYDSENSFYFKTHSVVLNKLNSLDIFIKTNIIEWLF